MADTKFTALPSATAPLTGAEIIALVQGGVSKQAALSLIGDYYTGTPIGNVAYTILATDRVVYTTATLTVSRTWTLPAASAFPSGVPLVIADAFYGVTNALPLVIARGGSDTICKQTASLTCIFPGQVVVLASDGVSNWHIVGRLPASYQLYVGSSTTYNTPPGAKWLYVECWGGGGQGGGAATSSSTCSCGAGGGAGAYAISVVFNPAASYVVTIGAGGSGAAAGATGTAGADTSFGSVCIAKAGAGGTVMTAGSTVIQQNGAAGGAAASCTADYKVSGSSGAPGFRMSAAIAIGGNGGGSIFGNGGNGVIGITGGAAGGAAGTIPGSGGGGAATITTQVAGGAGANGTCRVTEYY